MFNGGKWHVFLDSIGCSCFSIEINADRTSRGLVVVLVEYGFWIYVVVVDSGDFSQK